LSFHTKYRPTSFDEVIGQPHVISSLKKAVKGASAKTFLFSGPAGTGKTTLARILANSFAGGEATAANIEEVAAADRTGVDEMRQLAIRAQNRAIGPSPIKTIILDECHRLTGNAWDALLKPIEEPPKHVYWVFCTTNPGKVPKTILTRCLRYELKPVSEELIYELLLKVAENEQLETPEEVLEAVAEAAGGSPRQALVFIAAVGACKTAGEAQAIMRSAGQSREVADLCKWLMGGRGLGWAEALKYVKALEGAEAESTRIAVVNYLSAVLMNTNGNDRARQLLGILEPFLGSYDTSDRMAPLLRSIGLALNLDKN
jgi:DNA polymerase III delta prime subunit